MANLGLPIAQVAKALAEPSRVAMLDVLMDGDSHAIGHLARAAHVSPGTASTHLQILVEAGLVSVANHGRERRVRIADHDVAEILERLATLTTRTDNAIRYARTCYDHLAGVLAILVVQQLIDRAWLHPTTDNLEPSPDLIAWLEDHGQPVAASKRPLSRACLDWTERVPHVAGRVGAALCAVFVENEWVTRIAGTRALRVTSRGRKALAAELGLTLPVLPSAR
ncbi:MAG: metalloregulator ArsR/SmtB family transcription factor [Kofleriaceae bacterium]